MQDFSVPGLKKRQIARWESTSGKHWVNLHSDRLGHAYDAPGAGGSLGNKLTDDEAIGEMQRRVDAGHFQPDAAKTPMKRIEQTEPVRRLPLQPSQFEGMY